MYTAVIDFAQKYKYAHVLIGETLDIFSSLCKEIILSLHKEPTESLSENIRLLALMQFDNKSLKFMHQCYDLQHECMNFDRVDLNCFLCSVAYVLLKLREGVMKNNTHLAECITELGIEICMYIAKF